MAEKKAQVSAEKIKATRLAGGKRMVMVTEGLVAGKAYGVDEAVKIIKARAKARRVALIFSALT